MAGKGTFPFPPTSLKGKAQQYTQEAVSVATHCVGLYTLQVLRQSKARVSSDRAHQHVMQGLFVSLRACSNIVLSGMYISKKFCEWNIIHTM